MTRAKGRAETKQEEQMVVCPVCGDKPGVECDTCNNYVQKKLAAGFEVVDLRTFAEKTRDSGVRDDEHIIYEMFNISQYSDGSVLNCITMTTFTAKEVVNGTDPINATTNVAFAKTVSGDLKRNAKAALKNGTTTNLAPKVLTITEMK